MSIENEIKDYINNYFTPDELITMKKYYFASYDHDDTTENDFEYIQLCNFYKKLAGINENGKYRVEIDKSASALLEKLFARYVSADTFVITTVECHMSTKQLVSEMDQSHVYKICTGREDHKSNKIYEEVFAAFKYSGCKRVLVLLEGIIQGFEWIIDNSVFLKFKYLFERNNIPTMLILDDCQGIFHINRDYSIFDAILATGHTLEVGFDMGILFTKLSTRLGYVNKCGLKRFAEKIEILAKHKDKANQFNSLLTRYFKPLESEHIILPKEGVNSHHFTMHLNDIQKIPSKLAVDLTRNYLFISNEMNAPKSWLRIRYHEFIVQNPDKILEGLNKTKIAINKALKYQDLQDVKSNEIKQNYFNPDDLATECRFRILDDFYHYKDQLVIDQIKQHMMLRNTMRVR